MKNKNTIQLNQMHEVTIVYKRPVFSEMCHVNSSQSANEIIRNVADLTHIDHKECFWLLLLNNGNRLLGISEIGKGNCRGTVVNILEIFQLCIKSNACGIVLSHNHPSGKLTPSDSDKKLTKRIQKAAELFSITLLDHLIITSENYFSFADECYL